MKRTFRLRDCYVAITVDHEYPANLRYILRRATANRELIKNTLTTLDDLRVHATSQRIDAICDIMQIWKQKMSDINGLISTIRQRPVKTIATLTVNGQMWTAYAKCSKDDFNKSSKRLGTAAALKNLLRKCAEENILSTEQRRLLYQHLEQFIR